MGLRAGGYMKASVTRWLADSDISLVYLLPTGKTGRLGLDDE